MKNLILTILTVTSLLYAYNRPSAQGFADSPWPMYGHNPEHTHRGVQAPPATNVLKWKFQTNGEVYAPSIGEDGTIYAGSYDQHVYAINPDGTLKWKFVTDSPIYESTPAIGSDGTIYIGSLDKSLYAVNPDSTLKWKYTTNGPIRNAAAIGSDGCIYVPSGEEDHYMRAINPDGTLRWEFAIGRASTPVIGVDGTLYFGSDIGYLCALEPEQETDVEAKALSFSVEEPHPNPFNPSTTLSYSLDTPSHVRISIYSVTGQKVVGLVDSMMGAGRHSATFNGSKVGAGLYFYRFESGNISKTGKMMLVK